MTVAVQQLLSAFDTLTDAEKYVAAVEVLRRSMQSDSEALSDDALVSVAEGLFLELDAREAADAKP